MCSCPARSPPRHGRLREERHYTLRGSVHSGAPLPHRESTFEQPAALPPPPQFMRSPRENPAVCVWCCAFFASQLSAHSTLSALMVGLLFQDCQEGEVNITIMGASPLPPPTLPSQHPTHPLALPQHTASQLPPPPYPPLLQPGDVKREARLWDVGGLGGRCARHNRARTPEPPFP